jgi:signal peptidase
MSERSVRRVLSVLGTVIGVLILAAFVIQAVPGIIGADASYVVLSGSMEPAISPGDAVVVDSVDPTTIDRGDVITFTRGTGGVPVTHRVVDIRDGDGGLVFETKGDANEDADPEPVAAEQVTGEVWFVIPFIGHVIFFANTPAGLIVLVGIPIVGFVLSELYVFARGRGSSSTASGSDSAADGVPEGKITAMNTEKTDRQGEETDRRNNDAVTDTQSTAASHQDGIVVTGMDLKLSAVGFGLLAGYSGYVVYQRPEPVHVGVFVAALLVLTFLAIILVQDLAWVGSDGSPSDSDSPDGATADALADGGRGTTEGPGGENNDQ